MIHVCSIVYVLHIDKVAFFYCLACHFATVGLSISQGPFALPYREPIQYYVDLEIFDYTRVKSVECLPPFVFNIINRLLD